MKIAFKNFHEGRNMHHLRAVVYLYMYLRKINEQLGWIIWKKKDYGDSNQEPFAFHDYIAPSRFHLT